MQHGNYDDFWKARNIRPHLKNIKPAVMTVGGWFDAENLFGALEVYRNAREELARDRQSTRDGPVGPRRLGRAASGSKLGDVPFNAKTAEFYREKIEFPFFEYHLKGKGKPRASRRPGSSRRARTSGGSTQTWPPKQAQAEVALLPCGRASLCDAPAGATSRRARLDEYVSDPAQPVPFIDTTAIGMAQEYMTADQRFASRRPDVLVYRDRRARRGRDASPGRSRSTSSSRRRGPTPTGSSS